MSTKRVEKADKAKMKLVPVKELIAVHADRLGYKPITLAPLLGYSAHNVVSMLISGSMRLPINKVAITAEVLKIDPLYLAMCLDAETNFGLAPLLESISKRTAITLNEEKLIQKLRAVSNGMDIDMDEYPQELDAMVKAYGGAVEREERDYNQDVKRLKEKKRSALSAEDRKAA